MGGAETVLGQLVRYQEILLGLAVIDEASAGGQAGIMLGLPGAQVRAAAGAGGGPGYGIEAAPEAPDGR
jgi:hypothetical protein